MVSAVGPGNVTRGVVDFPLDRLVKIEVGPEQSPSLGDKIDGDESEPLEDTEEARLGFGLRRARLMCNQSLGYIKPHVFLMRVERELLRLG